MQTIIMYLRADSVNAQLVDSYNQVINSLPALTRGLRARLILKLLDADGQPLSENLNKMVSWDFVIADDWSSKTAPQIRVTEGITVSGNEIHIPLTETNTEELIASLGTSEELLLVSNVFFLIFFIYLPLFIKFIVSIYRPF